ncbi:hypothetical protein [Streptomyces hesseae]|uniref:Uncharacterized protein n=1 Tax=Streptomyces hesseae TaxID=3075519 RepID=A0ABU2SIB5_9ACTN|nr:hypothetical protein [Streptomyces sp. DSM 40473]MDT0448366.1 hypothetical protein [Streptomyces sp. DSM 40473]
MLDDLTDLEGIGPSWPPPSPPGEGRESWGRAPYGYDQATLYAYGLHQPDLARRVRTAFPELGTPATWTGEATIAAELLQTVARGDNAELAEPLHAWAKQLHARARVTGRLSWPA